MYTIKDLLNDYNIDEDAPDYVLDYVISEDKEYFGEYSKETDEHGKTIHVFRFEGDVEDLNTKLITENILDLNENPSWMEFRRFGFEDEFSASGVSFQEDGSVVEYTD